MIFREDLLLYNWIQDFPHDDDEAAEMGMEMDDLGLVNLHMQVNKPITDSPLLMSSYISHLTQLRCAHWTDPVAAFHHEQQQQNGDGGGKILADFDVLEEGFSVIKMCDKAVSGLEDVTEEDDKQREEKAKLPDGVDWDMEFMDGEFESSLSDGNTSKTTVIVNFKGSIDIICCPIALESVEKMFDSLVSTFESLHPISVVNHLHSQSIGRVESRNTLKKEKSLDLQVSYGLESVN